MRIVVVDDNARFAEDVIRTIGKFFSQEGRSVQIRCQDGICVNLPGLILLALTDFRP